ncbi:MAG: hypothetical protein ACI9MR_001281, partial [Myxococcota bacterium]
MVRGDPLDAADFEVALSRSKRLSELVARGERLVFDFRMLLQDLFTALVKLNVVVRPIDEVPLDSRVRHRLVSMVLGSSAFEGLHPLTVLRPGSAGYAAWTLGERALALYRQEKILSGSELQDQVAGAVSRETQEERDALRESIEALESAGALDGEQADALRIEISDSEDPDEDLERRLGETATAAFVPGAEGEFLDAADAVRRQLEEKGASESNGGGGDGDGGDTDAIALHHEMVQLPGMRKLVRLVGAFQAEARAARRRRVPRAATEVYGIQQGGPLSRSLPSELVMARHPQLRRVFMAKFAENRLLGYRLRGDDNQGRGPAVFLLDVSGSMSGVKLTWAKAVVLAMADLARRERRRVTALCFSSGGSFARFDLAVPRLGMTPRTLDETGFLALSRKRAGGGTEFQGPLEEAFRIVEEERDLRRGDIVLVTDGEADLSADVVKSMRARAKLQDTRLFGVLMDV